MNRLLAVVCLVSCAAFAQKEKEEKLSRQIDLSEIAIEAEIVKPMSAYALSKPRPGFDRLFKVRTSFAPELQKSADQL